MPMSPERLDMLDQKLLELEVMMLSQLDGLLAGVIVCPELVPPSVWLPVVWRTDDGEPFVFEDARQFETMTGLVMEHYNNLIGDLNAGRYEPHFEIDNRNGDVLWEMWAEGFGQALKLALSSWDSFLKGADEEVAAARTMLIALIEIADGESALGKKNADALTEQAPDLIPACVEALHLERLKMQAYGAPSRPERKGPKAGRNDACPCGSGKKYKKCCGAN